LRKEKEARGEVKKGEVRPGRESCEGTVWRREMVALANCQKYGERRATKRDDKECGEGEEGGTGAGTAERRAGGERERTIRKPVEVRMEAGDSTAGERGVRAK